MKKKWLNDFFHFTKQYRAEFGWVVVGLTVQLFSGVFLIKLLTNFLSTDDYGRYSLINSIVQFIEVVFFSSFIQGAGRHAYFLENISHSFQYARQACRIFFYIIGVFAFGSIFFCVINGNYDVSICIFIVFVLIFLDVNRDIYVGIFHMKRNRKTVTLYKSADQFLRMVIVIIFGLIGWMSLGTLLGGFVLINLFLVFLLRAKEKKQIKLESILFDDLPSTELNELKSRIRAFAIPFALLSVFTWLQTWADRWVLNFYLDTSKVGIYSANSQVANVPFFVLSSIILMFFAPILFSDAEKVATDLALCRLKRKINRLFLFYFLISFVTVILIFGVKNLLLAKLLTHQFIQSEMLFEILAIGWLLYQMAQVQATFYLYTTGDSKYVLYSNILSGVCYVMLLFFLIERAGEIGVAYAFIVSGVFRIIFQYLFSIKAWKKYQERLNLKYV